LDVGTPWRFQRDPPGVHWRVRSHAQGRGSNSEKQCHGEAGESAVKADTVRSAGGTDEMADGRADGRSGFGRPKQPSGEVQERCTPDEGQLCRPAGRAEYAAPPRVSVSGCRILYSGPRS